MLQANIFKLITYQEIFSALQNYLTEYTKIPPINYEALKKQINILLNLSSNTINSINTKEFCAIISLQLDDIDGILYTSQSEEVRISGNDQANFLLVHLLFLFELYAKTHFKIYDNKVDRLPIKDKKRLLYAIAQEAFLVANAFRIKNAYSNEQADGIHPQADIFLKEFMQSLLTILTQMDVGDELCFPCGFKNHAIYLNIVNIFNNYSNIREISLRLDNLGKGCDYHPPSGNDDYIKPFWLTHFSLDKLKDEQNELYNKLYNYLSELCKAKFLDEEAACQIIYDTNQEYFSNNIKNDSHRARKKSSTGNCVIANYLVGVFYRLERLFPDEIAEVYAWMSKKAKTHYSLSLHLRTTKNSDIRDMTNKREGAHNKSSIRDGVIPNIYKHGNNYTQFVTTPRSNRQGKNSQISYEVLDQDSLIKAYEVIRENIINSSIDEFHKKRLKTRISQAIELIRCCNSLDNLSQKHSNLKTCILDYQKRLKKNESMLLDQNYESLELSKKYISFCLTMFAHEVEQSEYNKVQSILDQAYSAKGFIEGLFDLVNGKNIASTYVYYPKIHSPHPFANINLDPESELQLAKKLHKHLRSIGLLCYPSEFEPSNKTTNSLAEFIAQSNNSAYLLLLGSPLLYAQYLEQLFEEYREYTINCIINWAQNNTLKNLRFLTLDSICQRYFESIFKGNIETKNIETHDLLTKDYISNITALIIDMYHLGKDEVNVIKNWVETYKPTKLCGNSKVA